jgi:hypothetical protein
MYDALHGRTGKAVERIKPSDGKSAERSSNYKEE